MHCRVKGALNMLWDGGGGDVVKLHTCGKSWDEYNGMEWDGMERNGTEWKVPLPNNDEDDPPTPYNPAAALASRLCRCSNHRSCPLNFTNNSPRIFIAMSTNSRLVYDPSF